MKKTTRSESNWPTTLSEGVWFAVGVVSIAIIFGTIIGWLASGGAALYVAYT
jgi:hypothetical protein